MTRGKDDLAKLTTDELRVEMQRCAGKDIMRARACLDLWLQKTGHTPESVAAMISERLAKAARSSGDRHVHARRGSAVTPFRRKPDQPHRP